MELTPDWLHKVSQATGRKPEEVEEMVERLYDKGMPMRRIEQHLEALAQANGKRLMFAPPGLS